MANTDKSREARLRVIETILLWEGEISNERVREILGIQVVQASRVLSEYISHNPEQVSRDTTRSPYKSAPSIRPKYSLGTVDEYIALSRLFDGAEALIVDVRYDLTTPTPDILSKVSLAIRNRVGLTIHYLSMTNPAGSQRLIYPHSIVRAGRRWHIRAWCTDKLAFRDFVIGRIQKAKIYEKAALHCVGQDEEWNKKVPLILGAHPKLNNDQINVIRNEFFNGAVSRRLMVRSCLMQYVIQDIRVAVNLEIEVPPDYQLAALNADEIKQFFFK